MKYDYCVVRFVPDAFHGEFVNMAVIAGSEASGEWKIRQVDNPQRARRLDTTDRLGAVWSYLAQVEDLFDRATEDQLELGETLILDRHWLEAEHRRLRNLVQLTEPAAVIAEDIDEAIDRAFDALVLDPERRTRRTRSAAVSAMRNAFAAAHLADEGALHEHATAVIGLQRAQIDFAVVNGSLAQLAHGWSFQAQDPTATVQQIKAWCWTVRDLRDLGGQVQLKGHDPYQVPRDVEVDVVYVDAISDQGQRARDESLEVFRHLNVTAVPVDQAEQVAQRALHALRH